MRHLLLLLAALCTWAALASADSIRGTDSTTNKSATISITDCSGANQALNYNAATKTVGCISVATITTTTAAPTTTSVVTTSSTTSTPPTTA
jgi:hypothetical protein